jgi:hypothetical protein
MVRRIGSSGTPEALALLVMMPVDEDRPSKQAEILGAMSEGLKGRSQVEMPNQWAEASSEADLNIRQSALATLLGARERDFPPVLQSLLKRPEPRSGAIRGLATYDDHGTPTALLGAYSSLSASSMRR